LGHPAVDEELDARDVATIVGSKERDYLGNFVQSSRATKRYFAHDTVFVLFYLFFRHACGIAVAGEGITRTHSVHAEVRASFLAAKYTSI